MAVMRLPLGANIRCLLQGDPVHRGWEERNSALEVQATCWGWDGGVVVPVSPLQDSEMSMVDALKDAPRGLDVEAASGTHGHAPLVHACPLAGGDNGADVIPGLEAVHALATHEVAARKAVPVQASPLVGTAPSGADNQ